MIDDRLYDYRIVGDSAAAAGDGYGISRPDLGLQAELRELGFDRARNIVDRGPVQPCLLYTSCIAQKQIQEKRNGHDAGGAQEYGMQSG